MNKLLLNGKWNLTGNKINCIAEIPGDFHTALLKNNIITDPFYGFNEQDSLWVGKSDWIIERSFDYKAQKDYRAILEFTQADTFFTLFINEIEIGKGQNAFTRHRFDITDNLKEGNNTIKFIFDSAERRNKEIYDNLPYPVPGMKYDVYSPHRNMSRKCQCNGGWDWGPCIMVSGIYGDIFIDYVKDGLFDYAEIFYHKNNTKWDCTIKVSYEAFSEMEKEFNFSISGQDLKTLSKNQKFNLHKGKNLLETTLTVENPWVWKTSGELKEEGLQENIIYDLNISDKENQITKKICFNTLKAVSEKDFDEGKEGRSIYFENNGRRIFAKGSNWIPVDNFPSRFTYERYYDLLKSAVDSNQNCMRVWGGGYYENEAFYDICDRLGIIVWQDMMFACALYPMTTDFLKEVHDEIEYQISRLQSHACIGIWCGNNENFGALNWFKESNENRVRYLVDYDRLYNGLIGPVIKELDPSRIYWPSSPCSGPDDFADNWHSDNMGDMHYWSVWHERKDKEAYCSIRPRFVSEFGYESFPSLNCIKSFSQPEDWNFTSRLMEYHQRSPSGNSIILENFTRYFRFPEGFANMIYLSQVQQAVAIKTAVDWWRSLKPHCMGSLVWQLNDIWPGPSWSSLEYSGKWKLLQYEEKKFFENVYMPAFIKDGELHVSVCNDIKEKINYKIQISFLNYEDGKKIEKDINIESCLNGDETNEVFVKKVCELSNAATSSYFIYVSMTANSSNNTFYSDNTVFPGVYKHAQLQQSNIKSTITKSGKKQYEIILSSDVPSFFVSLDTVDISGRFSTNMITLLPGKQEKIVFTTDEDLDVDQISEELMIFDLYESSREKK